MARAYIGLGSNLGDRMANVGRALDRLGDLEGVHVTAVSSAYESEAWPDPTDPPFVNAVAEVDSALDAFDLLDALEDLEVEMGREPSARNAPRVIDLDILLFGADEIASAVLTVPHPRLLEREFALTPLLEVAPDAMLPDGRALADVARPTSGRILRVIGPLGDPGEAHQEPLLAEDWVAVSESTSSTAMIAGPDPSIAFDASILSAEGIPFAWDPYEPGGMSDPIGLDMTVRLVVPAEHAAQARAVLADAANAVVVLDEELEPAAEAEPDEAEYS
jgi:2-amino-4-hydroxy-6-hydroxymethyldihydropteridine diphosphokinase